MCQWSQSSAAGYSWTNRHIGHVLGIGERTVREHVESIFGKLGCSNRTATAGLLRGPSCAGGPGR